jgi:hypothetical protein
MVQGGKELMLKTKILTNLFVVVTFLVTFLAFCLTSVATLA